MWKTRGGGAKVDGPFPNCNPAPTTRPPTQCGRLKYVVAPDRFTGLRRNFSDSTLESQWASPPTVPATSGASAHTDSARAWQRSGDAKFSAAAERRDASVSPFSFRASTPAPEPSRSPDDDYQFPRRYRLTRGAELQAVVREGKRLRTTHLDVRAVASPRPHSRVGFIVPKYGYSSVQRNRVKRRLRELVRRDLLGALRELPVGAGADVVIRAKPEAYRAAMPMLQSEFAGLGTRIARLVAKTEPPARNDQSRPAGNV